MEKEAQSGQATWGIPKPGTVCMLFAVLAIFLFGIWGDYTSGVEFQQGPSRSRAPEADSFPDVPMGSGSCSGRACHGASEPRLDSAIQRNEYSTWLTQDKHARSYDTLLSERSKRMAENLGIEAAHTDLRCLACHVNPALAREQSLLDTPLDIGIGCESCHGKATSKWLASHSTPGWKKPASGSKLKQYEKARMNFLGDPITQSAVCVGCHVGEPYTQMTGFPGRDLNHDLMAAGHPRLTFESFSHLANMPPHWNTKKYEALPGRDLDTWFAGQVTTPRAMSSLLASRAENAEKSLAPWPEFADFSCFACHADFQGSTWRTDPKYLQGRKPGSSFLVPWSKALLTDAISLTGIKDNSVQTALGQLEKGMAGYSPDAKVIGPLAAKLKLELDKVRAEISSQLVLDGPEYLGLPLAPPLLPLGAAKVLLERLQKKDLKAASWDETAQIYFALAAITRSEGSRNKAVPPPLDALVFPSGYESPKRYRPEAQMFQQFFKEK